MSGWSLEEKVCPHPGAVFRGFPDPDPRLRGGGGGARTTVEPYPASIARRLASALAVLAATAALIPSGASAADPATASSALGIPCAPFNGARFCQGVVANRVPSWDGVPLDADVYLPPEGTAGPYPLIVALHGFGVNKLAAFENPNEAYELAKQGYAVLAYSARGLGLSCGVVASRTPGACEKAGSISPTLATRAATPSTSRACSPTRD